MNKMKKLLSVVLAVVLAFSALSVLGSAARTNYKTVADLEALDAYSPYGQVTRLSLEERTSILLDAVDALLPGLNINMGEVFNVLGLSVTIDLTSVDRLCYSLDTIKDTFESTLASIAMGIVNLGILESLETGKWTTGMSRDGTAQFTIVSTLLAFLSDNTTLVNKLFTDGLDLGIVSLGDMSAIEKIIMDLPGLVKGLVFPKLERWDDTLTEVKWLDTNGKGDGKVEETVNTFVKSLFSNDMSITTIKYDANGNMTSEHQGWLANTGSAAPGTPSDSSPRCYYQFSSTTPGSVLTVYHIVDEKESEALAKTPDEVNGSPAAYTYFVEKQTYVMTQETPGSATYVWRATDDWGNIWSLKWYNDDSKWLDGISGNDINLSENGDSLATLLYKFIPPVFNAMAPVVLNGSVKKVLADFLGASFKYVGQVGDDAVNALPDASDVFFTQEQGEYLWEWSDYKVINGNHYYRFEDQIFAGDISQKNNYFDIINWDYKIEEGFMDEFVPENGGATNDTLLMNLNDFLIKVANTALKDSCETEDAISGFKSQWTKPALTTGGNENLVANIKAIAQTIIGLAPQHVFGDDWDDEDNQRCYVNLMLANYTGTGYDAEGNAVTIAGVQVEETNENDTILMGIAAHLVNMLMPSVSLPGKDDLVAANAKVGAILAAVVREFAAYLAPEYNFDALIYADFGTTTDDNVKTFVDPTPLLSEGQTASGYWLDVILTMGINVGYEYLRAFADMGEDNGVVSGVVGDPVYYMADGGTFAAGTTQAALNAQWEGMLDYIIDWALEADYEWSWAMENLVDTSAFTVDLATAQDPWLKLDTILNALLPADEILNVTATDCETELEQLLRYDLILGLVDLRWDDVLSILEVPDGFVRNTNILDQLATKLKNIVNYLFKKLGGGSYELIPSVITDFDSLAVQGNLVTMVVNLVKVLHTGLVTNGGCRTLFPFLNFLLGWKTDPQKIADPVMGYDFKDGNDYAFQGSGQTSASSGTAIANTYITFLNNSAGMLEIHRNSTVTDHSYDINIVSVEFDATVNNDLGVEYVVVTRDDSGNITETASDANVTPYEKVWIKLTGTYKGEEAVTMTIGYNYVGKDGQAVGGTQYTSYTFLISGLYEDANHIGTQANDHDKSYGGIYDFKSYVFTEDLFTTVTEYEQEIHYVAASLSNPDQAFKYCYSEGSTVDCNNNKTADGDLPTAPASNYFAQYEGQAGGWESTLQKEGQSTVNGLLYYAKDGVTADTEFAYGAYDMGGVGVKYGDDTKVWYVDFIYYNDYGIDQVYADNKDNGYNAHQGVDAATWEAYRVAWNNIVKLATYPMMTTARNIVDWNGYQATGTSANDYVSAIMPQIEPAIEAFETAKKNYETALADAQSAGASSSLPSYVQALAAEIENDFVDGKEIDFQDYDFYEYFNYSDVKEEGENLYRTFLAPKVMDKYYIVGSGISEAELDLVAGKEANAAIKAGILASRTENKAEDISASQAAHDEWKQPTTSKLIVEDTTARIAYYKQFLAANAEPNTYNEKPAHMYFLEQEIAHINAQGLIEEDFTAASWARFAETLEIAEAVAAGSDEYGYSNYNSDIYSVKYNLMVAYKNLLPISRSLIEAGGIADLQANVAIAEEIFASLGANDGNWVVKEGVDANKAYAELISALGYNYQAVYSENDIEVQNGDKQAGDLKYYDEDETEPMMFNLYADSALEYVENDRPNNQNNQAKVNTSNAALEAAIANFEAAVTEPNTLVLRDEYADYGIFVDTEIAPMMACEDWYPHLIDAVDAAPTGMIYGLDTVGYDDNFSSDVYPMIADAFTTAYGDDYLEVILPESSIDGFETTGTIINVLDEDGAVVETYYFVYFGDVNGDAYMDSIDVAAASEFAFYGDTTTTVAETIAGDYNGDTYVDSIDVATMSELAFVQDGYSAQADIAEIFYATVYGM